MKYRRISWHWVGLAIYAVGCKILQIHVILFQGILLNCEWNCMSSAMDCLAVDNGRFDLIRSSLGISFHAALPPERSSQEINHPHPHPRHSLLQCSLSFSCRSWLCSSHFLLRARLRLRIRIHCPCGVPLSDYL